MDEIRRLWLFVSRFAALLAVLCLSSERVCFCWHVNGEGLVHTLFGTRVVKGSFEHSSRNRWNPSSGSVSDGKHVAIKTAPNGDAVIRSRRLLRGTILPASRIYGRILSRQPSPSLSPLPSPTPFSPSPSPASESSQSRVKNSPNASPFPPATPVPPISSPSPNQRSIPAAPTISASPTSPSAPTASSSRSKNHRAPSPSAPTASSSQSKNHRALILFESIGGPLFFFVIVIGIFFYRCNKVATVRPWASGLSGQLQRAFVTGVPKLKKSELESACEDFSNVVGTSSIGTVFKGTLSTGVEIAVISVAVPSSKDWTKSLEAQFRKKIDTLSKVNHKNFVNLIGHCEEDRPFTRMMVFEYAPNGTLFEHLHVHEAEHLDWGVRLRIAMGIAYCLEHMHQLTPPITHNHLNSSVINLTEDYAAKLSDFSFSNELPTASEMGPTSFDHLKTYSAAPEANVHSFGLILLEIVTGRLPYSANNGLVQEWTFNYLRGNQPLLCVLDPTLESFQEEQLGRIDELIKSCVLPQPQEKPTMREVTASLREITGISPAQAIPKLSPLWWAELEIVSVDRLEDEVQSSTQSVE